MAEEHLRLVVVGAGIMGSNHVRVGRNLRDASLVAVVDPDLDRARAAAGTSGIEVVERVEQVVDRIDAAVVAVPTAQHVDTALELIEGGVHLLVEKPLAATAAAGRELVDAAESAGLVLAVGHVERFNPAVVDLPSWVEQPIHVETVRTSPYTARISDGVVFDLLIHDIDIVCSLAGPEAVVEHIDGVSQTVRSPSEDLVSVNLRFSTGLTAHLTASRLGQEKIRRIEVTQDDSVVIADLLRQSITIQRMSRHEFLSDQGMSYRQSSVVEVPFIETRGEPLALELQHFVDCVRGAEQPRVDGGSGVRAVELAERIVELVT